MSHVLTFMRNDHRRTLFPLRTNLVVAQYAEQEIQEFITKTEVQNADGYLNQQRVYALKSGKHLRRTVKLDPIAEYFTYYFAYKNRAIFSASQNKSRDTFGYRFKLGKPISPTASFAAFRGRISEYQKKYKYFVSFDVASYFNNIYHHDLSAWFSSKNNDQSAGRVFDRFFREANGGRSTDCLPHGLYPTKMIGNDFLSFVNNSSILQSTRLIRFMDDFYIFSGRISQIDHDVLVVQQLLGEKGLSVNPSKTKFQEAQHVEAGNEVDRIKSELLNKRRSIIMKGYDWDDSDWELDEGDEELSEEELGYIRHLLGSDHIDESDVEMILSVMRDKAEIVEEYLADFAIEFPHLIKNICLFIDDIGSAQLASDVIRRVTRNGQFVTEYQIFWLCWLFEEQIVGTKFANDCLGRLFQHQNATDITKAKILEIDDARHGIPELQTNELKNGNSNWLSWAAAVGIRSLPKQTRNHHLMYFAKASAMNKLISNAVRQI